MKDGVYTDSLGGVKWDWKDTMKVAKIQGLKFKNCIYKVKDKKGKNLVNYGAVDFIRVKLINSINSIMELLKKKLKSLNLINLIQKRSLLILLVMMKKLIQFKQMLQIHLTSLIMKTQLA